MKDPVKISELLERILPGSTAQLKTGEMTQLFQQWRFIAGERLVSHSQIKALDKGSLIIDVDHPGWMQMFKIEEKSLLLRLKSKLPGLKVERLKLRLVNSLEGSPELVDVPPRESLPLDGPVSPDLASSLEALKKTLEGEENSKKTR